MGFASIAFFSRLCGTSHTQWDVDIPFAIPRGTTYQYGLTWFVTIVLGKSVAELVRSKHQGSAELPETGS